MDTKSSGSGYYLFGRDVMAIPCFRSSVLTGFASGIGTSLLHFLFTSDYKKSFKLGKIAFLVVTFPYWYICQDREYEKRLVIEKLKKEIDQTNKEEYILLDSLEFGTETSG